VLIYLEVSYISDLIFTYLTCLTRFSLTYRTSLSFALNASPIYYSYYLTYLTLTYITYLTCRSIVLVALAYFLDIHVTYLNYLMLT